ncbi:hypothetical protein ACIRPP_26995 [Streptomyces sp. NPDC101219]|uniref:hypothetical protein n=1 Tax=Streptomyces sp. NPDC101219 TaxID=3366131 RepID=UPI0037FE848E
MTLTDAEMTALLAPAGLRFIRRWDDGEVRLPALPPGYGPASALPEHGRFDAPADEIADVNAPEMPEKVNTGWFRMAATYGLFDSDREFLLGVNYAGPDEEPASHHAWAQVRLLDDWDLVASEVDQLRSWFAALFTTRFVPEFSAVSLDGRTSLTTTVWGNGTVSSIAIRPS